MQETAAVRNIVILLQEDAFIAPILAMPPESILMPFANERSRRYLMVNVAFLSYQTLEKIASVSRRIVGIVIDAGLLDNLQGFEVMFSFIRNGNPTRALRLSVFVEEMAFARNISEKDLSTQNLRSGVSSIIYCKDLIGSGHVQ